MSNVTLIMSRTPLEEISKFDSRKSEWMSGRWGTMIVLNGTKISAVSFANSNNVSASGIRLAGKSLNLEVQNGGTPELVAEFDTMERFRSNSSKKDEQSKGFYMQVKPRLTLSYRLTMYSSTLVKKLNKTGNCLRVHGHGYKQQGSGNDAGILVHEAPHIGWLIGCISPREKNNRSQDDDKQPSRNAMNTIFEAMGGFSNGKEASLFVLDW